MTTRIIWRRRISYNPALELLIPLLSREGDEWFRHADGILDVARRRLGLACGDSVPGNEAAGAGLGLVAYLILRRLRGTDAGGDVPRVETWRLGLVLALR